MFRGVQGREAPDIATTGAIRPPQERTLDAAQKLYESKLITYPRTDSRFITSDMAAGIPVLTQTAAAFIGAGADIPTNTGQVVNDAKVSDHHAIIPTAELAKFELSRLPENEKNILRLVSSRLVCAVNDKIELAEQRAAAPARAAVKSNIGLGD